MRFTVSRAATLAASMVLLSGCTTVHPGLGVRDPHADQNVNLSLLDTGSYPTKPSDPLGNAGSREAGAEAEARRMAEAVLVPFEVDISLTKSGGAAGPLTSADKLTSFFIEDIPVNNAISDAIKGRNLIAGFKDSAESPQTNGLMKLKHLVLRFATPEDAAAAVAAMADRAEHEVTEYSPARRAQSIPDHPDLRAFSADDKGKRASVFGFLAHGPYALVEFTEGAYRDSNLDDAIKLLTATVDKQIPALDDFKPTPVDKLADLPLDPNGLLARTLPVPKNATNPAAGIYGPRGALHFMSNAQRSQKLFDDTGMTELARAGATVYQTRDADAATKLADDIISEIGSMSYPSYLPDDLVSGLPAARCMKPDKVDTYTNFRCVGTHDRYVIEVGVPGGPEVRRAFAAQYVMLAAQ